MAKRTGVRGDFQGPELQLLRGSAHCLLPNARCERRKHGERCELNPNPTLRKIIACSANHHCERS